MQLKYTNKTKKLIKIKDRARIAATILFCILAF